MKKIKIGLPVPHDPHSYEFIQWKVLYLFGYETEFFPFQNNPKDRDPSYEMDLDLWDCLGRVKLVLQQNFIGLIQLFIVILDRGKPCLIAK